MVNMLIDTDIDEQRERVQKSREWQYGKRVVWTARASTMWNVIAGVCWKGRKERKRRQGDIFSSANSPRFIWKSLKDTFPHSSYHHYLCLMSGIMPMSCQFSTWTARCRYSYILFILHTRNWILFLCSDFEIQRVLLGRKNWVRKKS